MDDGRAADAHGRRPPRRPESHGHKPGQQQRLGGGQRGEGPGQCAAHRRRGTLGVSLSAKCPETRRDHETESVVFDQPRLNAKLTDDELEKIGGPRQHSPGRPRRSLPDYDCIVLGDVPPEKLPLADRKRLEQFVAERGGTLVIVAGHRYMPMAYADLGPDGGEADPIRKLLPIEKPRVFPADMTPEQLAQWSGFSPTLTADGRETKFMDLEEDVCQKRTALGRACRRSTGRDRPGQAGRGDVGLRAGGRRPTRRPDRARAAQRPDCAAELRTGRVLYVGSTAPGAGARASATCTITASGGRWCAGRPIGRWRSGNQYRAFRHVGVGLPQRPGRGAGGAVQGRQGRGRGGDQGGGAGAAPRRRRQAGGRGPADPPSRPSPTPSRPMCPNLPEGDYEIRLEMDAAVADKLLPSPAPDDPKPTGPLKASFTVSPPESSEMTDLSTEPAAAGGAGVQERRQGLHAGGRRGVGEEAPGQRTSPHTEHSEQKLWHGWTLG